MHCALPLTLLLPETVLISHYIAVTDRTAATHDGIKRNKYHKIKMNWLIWLSSLTWLWNDSACGGDNSHSKNATFGCSLGPTIPHASLHIADQAGTIHRFIDIGFNYFGFGNSALSWVSGLCLNSNDTRTSIGLFYISQSAASKLCQFNGQWLRDHVIHHLKW